MTFFPCPSYHLILTPPRLHQRISSQPAGFIRSTNTRTQQPNRPRLTSKLVIFTIQVYTNESRSVHVLLFSFDCVRHRIYISASFRYVYIQGVIGIGFKYFEMKKLNIRDSNWALEKMSVQPPPITIQCIHTLHPNADNFYHFQVNLSYNCTSAHNFVILI